MNFQEFIQTEEGQAGARKWQELGRKQGWTDQKSQMRSLRLLGL